MSDLTLAQVDADGAIRESLDATRGDTRAQFLIKAGLVGGGAFAGTALLALNPGTAGAASHNDVAILNFALTLEYLEASFYTEAEKMGGFSGELAVFTRVVGGHERAHVAALKKALGSKAVKSPKFNFHGTTESAGAFSQTSQLLEDTGVAAYKGQAPLIQSDALLAAALSIHTVEARHASWIRNINGVSPAPNAFDQPKSKSQILAAVADTKFIVASKPARKPSRHHRRRRRHHRTSGSSSPSFTG